jgi:predicted RNA-binding Zn-ribbon protein involved in translation (DUF1610 family)
VRKIEKVKEQAKMLGIFTDDRELLECPSCGLVEDVLAGGMLITYQNDSKGLKDSGLRFSQVDKTHFECPRCGTKIQIRVSL